MSLAWNAVPGAAYYILWGPGLPNTGVRVDSTRQVVGGVPAGAQSWTVGSYYMPGPISTSASAFTKATLAVNAVCSGPGTPPGWSPSPDTLPGMITSTAIIWPHAANAIAYIVDRTTATPGGATAPWTIVASNCAGAPWTRIVIAGNTHIGKLPANHAGVLDNVIQKPGTTTIYRVRAFNAAGGMGWNSIRRTSPPAPVIQIDSVRATGSTFVLMLRISSSQSTPLPAPDIVQVTTSFGTLQSLPFSVGLSRSITLTSVPLGPQSYTATAVWNHPWGGGTSAAMASTTRPFTLSP